MGQERVKTILAQIGNHASNETGAINMPVYFSTAYRHQGIGQSSGYDYTRTGNPTRVVLEETIAALEEADYGYAFSSGMATIQSILTLLTPGDECLVSEDLYGGTFRLFEDAERTRGLRFHYISSFDDEAVADVVNEHTKAIFMETPTNPLMQEISIADVSRLARKHHLYLIVDNTFFTPLLQQPIVEGADIVLHSATKYLGGHNDVLAGLVAVKGDALAERIANEQNSAGAVLSPFDSWLLMRGMKTLSLRMKQHEENAKAVTAFLTQHEDITEVLYPGQGGMLSFRLPSEHWVDPFLRHIRLITFAESLGGVESFITYPATQTHADVPEDIRVARGVDNCLVRFSVGIEDPDDLLADLDQALAKAKATQRHGANVSEEVK